MSELVLEQFHQGVLTLTLNRPLQRNALDSALCDALAAATQRAQDNSEVTVVVLQGAGGMFCVGGDVKGMGCVDPSEASIREQTQALRRRMDAARNLHDMAKPSIALIQGAAAGAGLALALACDLRIAAESAKLNTAFIGVGLSGDYGGSWFLQQLVGPAKARELYFTSPRLTAAEALTMGLVNRVVADDQAEQAAQSLAASLASGPSVALAYMKHNLNLAQHATLSECLDAEARHHVLCAVSDNHREAAAAFAQKRSPVFRGR